MIFINSKKKIFILTPFENVMTKRGNRHPLIADMLVNKGYDVTYVTTNFYHADKTFFSKEDIQIAVSSVPYKLKVQKNVGYKKILSPKRILSHIEFAIKTGLFLLKNKADLVLIPSRPMELIFVTSWISLIKRYKIILDVRDIWPDGFPRKDYKYYLFNFYCNTYLYSSMIIVKYFIYTAPSFIEWINKYSQPKKTIFVPLGYDSDRWKSIEKPIIHLGKWNLIFIGNFSINFDFKPLIDAVGKNKDLTLTMIGGGDNIDETVSYIKYKKYNNIIITGFIDKKEVVEYMKRNDITVIPMIGQAFPNKLFDSIGGKRPILIIGNNDASNFVISNDIGWSTTFKKDKISYILQNITDKEYYDKITNIEDIRKFYSKDILYLQINSFIEEIIDTEV